ncbi:MAG: PEP-CTERM sorting domain-containing protein [Armatimonadetes bacterium]|nr:PEP-CTERM sorting domain-containing protein [Armatimonadota bacterium]
MAAGSTLASDRYILINGVASNSIGRYDLQTGHLERFINVATQGGHNNALAITKSGNILVGADVQGGKVFEYSGLTGALIRTVCSTDTVPHGIAQGSDGNIYVGAHSTNSIKKYNFATGALMQTIVTSGQLGLNGCRDLRFNSAGDLFYVGAQSEKIYKIPNGGSPTVFASFTGDPSTIDFGFDGNIYAAGLWNSVIKRYSSSGTPLSDFGSGFSAPRGLAFNEWNGVQSLFISENATNMVKRYSTTGTLLGSFNTASVGVSDLSFLRSYTPVPEPTSIAIVGLGSLLLARRRSFESKNSRK